MRVLLIHPLHEKPGGELRQRQQRENDDREVCFPLGIAYIAAALKQEGHAVTPWDIHAENLLWHEVESRLAAPDFDLVGISAISSQYRYVKNLSALIKRQRDVPIVVGGPLATYSHKLLLERCRVDYCVLGEGEITAVDLLRNLHDSRNVKGIAYRDSQGRACCTEPREYLMDLGQLPMPAYEMFDMDFYVTHHKKMKSTRQNSQTGQDEQTASQRLKDLKTGYVIAGRGCPYHCRFCSRNFEGIRMRPLDHLVREIRYLRDTHGAQFIHFGDELVTLNKTKTLDLCAAMKETRLLWDCQSRVNVVDEEMLAAMKDAGCVTVGFGIESGSQRLLDAMKKAITVPQIENAMRLAMKLDLDIKVQLMFGFPGEDMSSLKETIDLFRRLGHPGRAMSFYTVLPGTEIYDFCVASKVIPDEDKYLCELAEGGGAGKVLLNFTRFCDGEIFPRIKWAKTTMRANACKDPVKHRELTAWARRKLGRTTTGSFLTRTVGRFAQWRRVGPILEELKRLNGSPG